MENKQFSQQQNPFGVLYDEIADLKRMVRSALESKVEQDRVAPPATRKEAAKFLKVGLSTLDTYTRTGQLKTLDYPGRFVRFNWSELERFIKERGE